MPVTLPESAVTFTGIRKRLMRPWAMGRKAWLFAGSELAGQRAAIVMSLVQSAKLNGHDPWAYLKGVLMRLPTHLKAGSTSCCRIAGSRWAEVSGRPVRTLRLTRQGGMASRLRMRRQLA